MTKYHIKDRLEALNYLRDLMVSSNELLEAVCIRATYLNSWFDQASLDFAISNIREEFLDPDLLREFADSYSLADTISPKNIGIIMAGNIPLVGFHDWLCCFIVGHKVKVKLSSTDNVIFPYIIKELDTKYPGISQTEFVEKLSGFEAIIATGSNNSNRYFEYYFKDVPNILRKNRTSVAVLQGDESNDDIIALGLDVLRFYGHGCRNVSKIFAPEGYDMENLMMQFMKHERVILNSKYKDNYDYNYGIWSINREIFYTNNSLTFKEDKNLFSRIASVYFEYYDDLDALKTQLSQEEENIQCLVGSDQLDISTVKFGETQQPSLSDYADGVDVVDFLISL